VAIMAESPQLLMISNIDRRRLLFWSISTFFVCTLIMLFFYNGKFNFIFKYITDCW
jgi:predicted MFS family arabinose efflux permease